jgi:hypothetical protein
MLKTARVRSSLFVEKLFSPMKKLIITAIAILVTVFLVYPRKRKPAAQPPQVSAEIPAAPVVVATAQIVEPVTVMVHARPRMASGPRPETNSVSVNR